jgi:hypothetical protein
MKSLQNKIKNMKNKFIKFLKRFTKPTPKKWKRIATTFGTLGTTFTTAFGAVKALSIDTPNYFNLFIGCVIFICAAITTYALQKEVPTTQAEIKADIASPIQ